MENFIYPPTSPSRLIAGVDEVGRGPLVGNVVTAAVILDPSQPINGLADSKKLSEKKRLQLAEEIKAKARSWCIACATPQEIDELNILNATLLAMSRAVAGLDLQPELVLVDGNRVPQLSVPAKYGYLSIGGIGGNRVPQLSVPAKSVIKGDSLVPEISAASILAKVARDEEMYALHDLYPEYAFDQHKGYPTKLHLEKLSQYGVLPQYRRSFAPVRKILDLAEGKNL